MTPLHVYGGVSNRLRTILSWRAAIQDDLVVAWIPDGEINSERFVDVFKPLDRVTVVDAPENGWPKRLDVHPNAPHDWERAWLEIQLKESATMLDGLYCAMHVRRTDCTFMQKEERTWRPDSDFVAWAARRPERRVYLATDNGATQRDIGRTLEAAGKLVTYKPIAEHDKQHEGGQRNTSLHDAWEDVINCVNASAFMGSGSSSFTTTIETLRRLR